MKLKQLLLTAGGCVAASLGLSAQTVSVNFVDAPGVDDLFPEEKAGNPEVFGSFAANWNNTSGVSGTITELQTHAGAVTGIELDWTCNNLWRLPASIENGDNLGAIWGSPGDGEANTKMMRGYLDTTDTSTTTIDVRGLAAVFPNGYRVALYFDGDNGGAWRTGRYSILSGSTVLWTGTGEDSENVTFNGGYIDPAPAIQNANPNGIFQVPLTPGAGNVEWPQETNNGEGNFFLSSELSGDVIKITATPGNAQRAPLNAIQFIAADDDDNDGMPNAWEEANGLNPTDPSDAGVDDDVDGLSNLAEFRRGTNPQKADTDGDGLSDSVETGTGVFVNAGNTGTNPIAVDTDGDGYTDGYEVAKSTNPLLDSSAPSVLSSKAININFKGGTDALPDGHAVAGAAGVVSSTHWNNVSDRATPVGSGQDLIDSDGTVQAGTWVEWSASNTWLVSADTPADAQGALMGGYLDTTDASLTTVTVRNIPYRTYLVYVYFDGDSTGRYGTYTAKGFGEETQTLTQIRDNANWPVAAGGGEFVHAKENGMEGNYMIFSGLTGGTVVVTATPAGGTRAPINGIQIVGAQDGDNDGMPDVWEILHGLNPGSNADAAADPDQDGSPNLQEYQRGTLPKVADTDSDGVLDGAETLSGEYVSPSNTGTNPLVADTDGDGLLDGEEVNASTAYPFVTNPNLRDTDGDGFGDGFEYNTSSSDPTNPSVPTPENVRSIGVCFVSSAQNGLAPGSDDYAGYYPNFQKHWNITYPLVAGTDLEGDLNSIASPAPGVLVDDRGTDTSATLQWTTNVIYATTNGANTTNALLISGYLDDTELAGNATVSLGAIPYAAYDVIVYFGSDGNGRTGSIYSLTSGEEFFYITASNRVDFLADDFRLTEALDAGSAPAANVCVFRGLTGATFELEVHRGSNNSGIHAVQIVDRSGAAAPAFKITNVSFTAATRTLALQWESEAGATYTVQRSTSLKSGEWTTINANVPSGGASTSYNDPSLPAAQTQYYYRVLKN